MNFFSFTLSFFFDFELCLFNLLFSINFFSAIISLLAQLFFLVTTWPSLISPSWLTPIFPLLSKIVTTTTLRLSLVRIFLNLNILLITSVRITRISMSVLTSFFSFFLFLASLSFFFLNFLDVLICRLLITTVLVY